MFIPTGTYTVCMNMSNSLQITESSSDYVLYDDFFTELQSIKTSTLQIIHQPTNKDKEER